LSEEKISLASTAPTTTINISALLICIIIKIYIWVKLKRRSVLENARSAAKN
jgi:hypothetical protein